jgi:hypothetical protein
MKVEARRTSGESQGAVVSPERSAAAESARRAWINRLVDRAAMMKIQKTTGRLALDPHPQGATRRPTWRV